MPDRFTRQRRLAEVGDAGQAALARASSVVSGADGNVEARLEALYLERAGIGRIERDLAGTGEPCVHAGAFRHAAALAVGTGAWRALRQIKAILGRVTA